MLDRKQSRRDQLQMAKWLRELADRIEDGENAVAYFSLAEGMGESQSRYETGPGISPDRTCTIVIRQTSRRASRPARAKRGSKLAR